MTEFGEGPHRREFVPRGGRWHGLLFDNPRTGHNLKLTWSFAFDYEAVHRDYGTTDPGFMIDWVPIETTSWRKLAGMQAVAHRFGEPIEASIYFFEHYRYDHVEIRVLDQQATELRVSAKVRGDLDGLGLDTHEHDQWLSFKGIYVQPGALPDRVESAEALLSGFTDITGLVGLRRQQNFLFRPTDPA